LNIKGKRTFGVQFCTHAFVRLDYGLAMTTLEDFDPLPPFGRFKPL
jgi:hypothetical protein